MPYFDLILYCKFGKLDIFVDDQMDRLGDLRIVENEIDSFLEDKVKKEKNRTIFGLEY